jgi:GDP-4-dehydro-6-deoxy-D-mannose reductase
LIEKGKQEPVIYVGNLEAERDYTDVRDMVRGYYLAATKGESGEVYNICSGKTWKIKKVLDYYLSLSKVKVEIRKDSTETSMCQFFGDNTKFVKRQPKYH